MPRQQTLRATIDWSYDLLSEPERRLLERLSVFAGGYSLEAAEQVCAGDEPMAGATIGLLSNLIDKSLVVVEDDGDSGRRYRLLETVRQYARDRLAERGDTTSQRNRHFQFFKRLALQAEPELRGPNQVAWVKRLGADHDNLRAAMSRSATTSPATPSSTARRPGEIAERGRGGRRRDRVDQRAAALQRLERGRGPPRRRRSPTMPRACGAEALVLVPTNDGTRPGERRAAGQPADRARGAACRSSPRAA